MRTFLYSTVRMKTHVTLSLETTDLERLDAWAKVRRLTRSSAVGALLDLASFGQPGAPEVVPYRAGFQVPDGLLVARRRAEALRGGEAQETAALEPADMVDGFLGRAPSTSELRRALGSKVLELTQKRVGVKPVVLEGDGVRQVEDPEADRGLEEFYGKQRVVEPAADDD